MKETECLDFLFLYRIIVLKTQEVPISSSFSMSTFSIFFLRPYPLVPFSRIWDHNDAIKVWKMNALYRPIG